MVVFDSADFETKIMQTLGARSKDVDVFVGEPQMLPNFYEAGFCADLSALDGEVKTRLVDYTYEAGCDEDGVLRAISYQACPGSVIYRRDLAKEVFGTDDPDEIAKHFSSFEEIEKTADTLQAKGYCVFGDEGALRWFSNRDPWVKDGQIIINQDRLDYMDCATHLYQNDQVAYALEWSAPWYASMAGPLPKISEAQSGDVWSMDKDQLISEGAAGGEGLTQVFSYVMPSWGALIVRDNAEGNKGNFGVCSGPCSFFGGGTFLTVNEFSQHKEAATLDGAGRWQTFSKITMPLLRPIMLYVAVTSLIGGLQLFDLPYLLSGTKGEPGRALYTSVFYIYTTAFTNHQMGYAAALAFVLFLIIAVFCGIAFALMNKKED